jgi:hypothetical protein
MYSISQNDNNNYDNSVMFDESYEVGGDDERHDNLRYDDLVLAGPPVQPLDFPTPTVHRATQIHTQMMDHRSGRVHDVTNVLLRVPDRNHRSDRAYLIRRKLSKTVFGSVRLCTVLRKRMTMYDGTGPSVEWKSTDETIVLKASSWSLIHQKRGKHLEDPLKGA